MAMNPDKYAKFFYEQGQADAIDNVSKKSKKYKYGDETIATSISQIRI